MTKCFAPSIRKVWLPKAKQYSPALMTSCMWHIANQTRNAAAEVGTVTEIRKPNLELLSEFLTVDSDLT